MAVTPKKSSQENPRAYEDDYYPWNLFRVPKTVELNGREIPHPARNSALFIVHGIGEQEQTETSATLRLGLEDALVSIREWQKKQQPSVPINADSVPPPFIYEGYWADYADIAATFPEDWKRFDEMEKTFFKSIWESRVFSIMETLGWLILQQFALLDPRRIRDIGFLGWLLYLPLLFITPVMLILSLIKAPRVITRVLADVRLYARPRGVAEHAIVQRIDRRVGAAFLHLLGLDWEFRPLPREQHVTCSSEDLTFDRVIWISHSLGTVVSYNVLSDLFERAAEIDVDGDQIQKAGAERFRTSLRRFITLGSPLDKFAYLFSKSLRPWSKGDHKRLLKGGEKFPDDGDAQSGPRNPEETDWWINFYDVFDPVSGALTNPHICGDHPPVNVWSNSSVLSFIPGMAHLAYWKSEDVTRFILSRLYGRSYLQDKQPKQQSKFSSLAFATIGYVVWVCLLYGIILAVWWNRNFLLTSIWKMVVKAAKGILGQ
jgi:hypothetical protein